MYFYPRFLVTLGGLLATGFGFISDTAGSAYDFERLEQAVSDLVDAHHQLQRESAVLRRKVDEKTRRVRVLDEKLLEANQRRQDVAKRVDELISQINQLDAQFADSEI